jgi:hypothetical protein
MVVGGFPCVIMFTVDVFPKGRVFGGEFDHFIGSGMEGGLTPNGGAISSWKTLLQSTVEMHDVQNVQKPIQKRTVPPGEMVLCC